MRHQRGFAMLEVLISIVVSVIGILGLIGLQVRTYQAESESYQRSQALFIVEDIAARVSSNRNNAPAYVSEGIGAGAVEDCTASASTAERDICEVGNLLRGAGEMVSGSAVGAMSSALACIGSPIPGTYVIAVVWAGIVPTGAPASPCGRANFADEGLRRAVSTVVVVADLEG